MAFELQVPLQRLGGAGGTSGVFVGDGVGVRVGVVVGLGIGVGVGVPGAVVTVGGMGVEVGGIGVAVGGIGVAVGGMGVAVGGFGVIEGVISGIGDGVGVGGIGVGEMQVWVPEPLQKRVPWTDQEKHPSGGTLTVPRVAFWWAVSAGTSRVATCWLLI